jgi:hypothetical protein
MAERKGMERDEAAASDGEGEVEESSSGGFTFAALRAMLGRIGPVAELASFLTNHKDFRISPDVADPTRAKGHILNDLRHHFVRRPHSPIFHPRDFWLYVFDFIYVFIFI